MGWLNSDDRLLPRSLEIVRELFTRFPEMQWLTSGFPATIDEAGRLVRVNRSLGVAREPVSARPERPAAVVDGLVRAAGIDLLAPVAVGGGRWKARPELRACGRFRALGALLPACRALDGRHITRRLPRAREPAEHRAARALPGTGGARTAGSVGGTTARRSRDGAPAARRAAPSPPRPGRLRPSAGTGTRATGSRRDGPSGETRTGREPAARPVRPHAAAPAGAGTCDRRTGPAPRSGTRNQPRTLIDVGAAFGDWSTLAGPLFPQAGC